MNNIHKFFYHIIILCLGPILSPFRSFIKKVQAPANYFDTCSSTFPQNTSREHLIPPREYSLPFPYLPERFENCLHFTGQRERYYRASLGSINTSLLPPLLSLYPGISHFLPLVPCFLNLNPSFLDIMILKLQSYVSNHSTHNLKNYGKGVGSYIHLLGVLYAFLLIFSGTSCLLEFPSW